MNLNVYPVTGINTQRGTNPRDPDVLPHNRTSLAQCTKSKTKTEPIKELKVFSRLIVGVSVAFFIRK